MAEIKVRYKYTRYDPDRYGNPRWYTFDPFKMKIRMEEQPGTDAFREEWKLIRSGEHPKTLAKQAKLRGDAPTEDDEDRPAVYESGSLGRLIAEYLADDEFKGLRHSTRRSKGRLLKNIQKESGDMQMLSITSDNIRAGRNARKKTPAAANNRMKALSSVYEWGKENGWPDYNPVRGVKHLKEKKKGATTWSLEDCKAFEAKHPLGTRARLFYALALYTGQRGVDLRQLGPQHIEIIEDPDTGESAPFIRVANQKTEVPLFIPIVAPLAEAINAMDAVGLCFIMTEHGKPFTEKGFTNAFKKYTTRAGLENRTLHGLRKAVAARLADHGLSTHEIQSVTGHLTLSEVQRYTREANQKLLATRSLKRLYGEQSVSLSIVGGGSVRQKRGKSK